VLVTRRWALLKLRAPAGFSLLATVASCLPQADAPLRIATALRNSG
jgi:hypothetical protein